MNTQGVTDPMKSFSKAEQPTSCGLLYKVEHFSINDGPGIRDLVIMKGCPLRCRWCSSPHTQTRKIEPLYIKSNCLSCGRCIRACPNAAITLSADNGIATDYSHCIGCGQCAEACTEKARVLDAAYYSAQDLVTILERNKVFYNRSGGGVTFGGGEPTLQPEFLLDCIERCQQVGISTAIETSAYCDANVFEKIAGELSFMHIDIKHMDSDKHEEWTGVSNELILSNIRAAAERTPLVLRIPVIPDFNDDLGNVRQMIEFAQTLGKNFLYIELLPYHLYGKHHYEELGRSYPMGNTQPPSDESMSRIYNKIKDAGVRCKWTQH